MSAAALRNASVTLRLEFEGDLEHQLATAKTFGLDHVGLPISSDAIASLFGAAKRHGVAQTPDAARIALRLPALCGRQRERKPNRCWESAWRDNTRSRDNSPH